MVENISKLSARKGLEENLFEKIADTVGPGEADPEQLVQLANEYHLGAAVPYGTASFYDFLKQDHFNKKVLVCNGSSCLCAGTQEKLADRLATLLDTQGLGGRESVGEVTCLGRCHENSSFQYQGQNFSGDSIESFEKLLAENLAEPPTPPTPKDGVDQYHVESLLDPPILTAPFPGVATYYKPLKNILQGLPEDALAEMRKSKLRGRGGAGFPAALKWEACRREKEPEKYIVCNADEGDAGAYIDRYLLEERPHSVLFGMLVAGYCSGAESGVLYIRAEYPQAHESIAGAIDELKEARLVGKSILGTDFNFDFKIIRGQGAYICGEETSLLASIEGRRPEVSVRPPYPTTEGLYGKPTVVNNVESLACVQHVFSIGGDAFSQIGTPDSTGPKLASLDGAFNRPGIYEVPMGTPLKILVEELGQGFRRPTKAMQIGGPLGGIVPNSKIEDLTFDFESFAEGGFLLGHAGVIGIPESMPMVQYMQHLLAFCAVESCGKCFPCRLGSIRGAELVGQAIDGVGKMDRQLLDDLLETLELGSLCGLGGGIPLPVRNLLTHFSSELEPFLSGDAPSQDA